jgi:hypothetical protein
MTQETEVEEKGEALAFVTKKALITLRGDVCILFNGSACRIGAFIIEYKDAEGNGPAKIKVPNEVTVIGFPDGRKLTERIFLHLHYDMVICVMELPLDWKPI